MRHDLQSQQNSPQRERGNPPEENGVLLEREKWTLGRQKDRNDPLQHSARSILIQNSTNRLPQISFSELTPSNVALSHHIDVCKLARSPSNWSFLNVYQFSYSVVSDSLWPHESHHARPPCPVPTPGVHPNSCPSSQWCHPAISSSVIPFSSCPQSLPASESFPMSQLFAWGGQSTGVSALALVLHCNT